MSKEDTQHTIGTLLAGTHERDAIHIAVMQVKSNEDFLEPGQGIRVIPGTNLVCKSDMPYGEADGVVDPFLRECLKKGDSFWMFLVPNTISGLRHVWSCPAIDLAPGNEHETWLREFAARWNFNYEELIQEAKSPNGIATAMGVDLHGPGELEGKDVDFWSHLECLTGMIFSDDHKKSFTWSCSC